MYRLATPRTSKTWPEAPRPPTSLSNGSTRAFATSLVGALNTPRRGAVLTTFARIERIHENPGRGRNASRSVGYAQPRQGPPATQWDGVAGSAASPAGRPGSTWAESPGRHPLHHIRYAQRLARQQRPNACYDGAGTGNCTGGCRRIAPRFRAPVALGSDQRTVPGVRGGAVSPTTACLHRMCGMAGQDKLATLAMPARSNQSGIAS